MAQKSYQETKIPQIANAKVAILQAQWHSEHTDRMVSVCSELLQSAGATVELFKVPGSYEIPLAAKKIAKLKKFDALVLFGAIVKGETDHYQVILDTCIREVGRVMYDYELPIIMEIMPVFDIKQLVARSTGEHNKGIEAAEAAAQTILWHRNIG